MSSAYKEALNELVIFRHSLTSETALIHHKSSPVTPVCQFSVKCVLCLCTCKASQWRRFHPVSYTHLTLPTNREV